MPADQRNPVAADRMPANCGSAHDADADADADENSRRSPNFRLWKRAHRAGRLCQSAGHSTAEQGETTSVPPIATRATAVVGVLLVSVGVAVALAGCSPDEPTPTATESAPRTTTPTPTPTVVMPTPAPSPTVPVGWTDDGPAGAEAAARYFVDLYTYTQSSQDVGPWIEISHDECVFCQSVLDDVDQQKAAGTITRSSPMTVTSATTEELNPLAFSVVLTVVKDPETLWSPDGQMIHEGEDVGGTLTLVVLRDPDAWVLRAITPSDPLTK